MTFSKSRLRRTEKKAGGTLFCPTCGLFPDSLGRIVISTEWMPADPDERCSGCGRRLWFVIEICGPEDREKPSGAGAGVMRW
jgi:hypothetical protein